MQSEQKNSAEFVAYLPTSTLRIIKNKSTSHSYFLNLNSFPDFTKSY